MPFYFRTTTETNFTGICPHLNLAQHIPLLTVQQRWPRPLSAMWVGEENSWLVFWQQSTQVQLTSSILVKLDLLIYFSIRNQLTDAPTPPWEGVEMRGLFFLFPDPYRIVFHLHEISNSVVESIMFSCLLVMWSYDNSRGDVPHGDSASVNSHKHVWLQP